MKLNYLLNLRSTNEPSLMPQNKLCGIEFATEGYSMWMSFDTNDLSQSNILGEMKFIKSCLVNNSAMVN